MFVPEVFEMLQNAFLQHHSKFNFPNKALEHSSPKFQAAIGQFTIALNDKIRTNVMNSLNDMKVSYEKAEVRYRERIESLKGDRVLLAAALGFSIALNVAAAILIF